MEPTPTFWIICMESLFRRAHFMRDILLRILKLRLLLKNQAFSSMPVLSIKGSFEQEKQTAMVS